MRLHHLLAIALVGAGGLPLSAGTGFPDPLAKAALLDVEEPAPWEAWAFGVDVGAGWRVTDNTHLDYVVVPTVFSIRTPAHWVWDFAGGTLVTRARLNLLAEGFAEGPESYYFGWSGSPSIEYWFPGERTAIQFSIGGGSGWLDSQGVPGGQGRDYTYNWFMHGALRQRIGERMDLSIGVFFQHLSNRGATDPNPGLDTLGPMVGLSWDF